MRFHQEHQRPCDHLQSNCCKTSSSPRIPSAPHVGIHIHHNRNDLTIRLLVPRSRTRAPKLLRLTPSIVRNQQRPIILHQPLLQQILRVLVHVFLVVGDDRLGDRLPYGVDLGCVAAAGDSDADVDAGEFVEADDEDGFVNLWEVW